MRENCTSSLPPAQIRTCGFPAYGLYGAFLVKGASRHFLSCCCFILLFDPRREHSSVPTAYYHRRRAQRWSRTALFQRRRRLVLDGREHGGRLPAIGWSAAQRSEVAAIPNSAMAAMPLGEWTRRVGALPAEAYDCFMVETPCGFNRIQAWFARRWLAASGRLPSDREYQTTRSRASCRRARDGQGQAFGSAEEAPSLTVAARDGECNMRSRRKNARGAGRTKE